MSDRLHIRLAAGTDAEALAELLGELGYPADALHVRRRLARFDGDPHAMALVACREGRVRGLATAHAHAALNRDEPAVQLTLLVVSGALRGGGMGHALVAAAESWAERQGARRLVVTTAVHRADAHAFYERLGYILTGRRYTRTW
ncbi:MAG: hypothetical protein AMXMBFR59_38400 [Rhodanobacteraceae bacterium]